MPSTNRPKYPRFDEILLDNDQYVNIPMGGSVNVPYTEVFDYVGDNNATGGYEPTATGTYYMNENPIIIVDGIVQPT